MVQSKKQFFIVWYVCFSPYSHFNVSIVATSTSEHDLHSNWVLRDPRRISMTESQPKNSEISHGQAAQRKGDMGSTGSRRCLQRNPIHLPKVVESAFQTLRFKPKLKKKN